MYKRILVPVDGSSTSNLGIREALKLAQDPGAKIRLVHIVDELVVVSSPDAGIPMMDDLIPALVDAGKKVLAKAKSVVEKAGGTAETSLIEQFGGRAADSIVAEARKWRADVIVIGTHGRRGLRRALLGSDAEEVLRTASVPVMLVRDRTADLPKATRAKARR
jgi:nucleotide-binding universal stress UspA family protein